jgi:hypothetical protein
VIAAAAADEPLDDEDELPDDEELLELELLEAELLELELLELEDEDTLLDELDDELLESWGNWLGDVMSVSPQPVSRVLPASAVAPESSSRNPRRLVVVIVLQIPQCAAGEVHVDAPDDLIGRDHVHASRQPSHDIDAQFAVLHIAVA